MNVLLVEDNPDHQDLITLAFGDFNPDWHVNAVDSAREALDLLEGDTTFSVILLDYSLPGEDGLEVLRQICTDEKHPPVIMVTGRGDETIAVDVMKAGAFDYVVKGSNYLTRLPHVVERALETHQLKIEHQQAEDELRKSEQRYRNLVENAPTGIVTIDLNGNIQEVNPQLLEILGSPSIDETKKINMFTFGPLIEAGISDAFKACINSGESINAAHPYTSKWGKHSYLHYHLTPIYEDDNQISGAQANVIDITMQMEAQTELEKLNAELEERVRDRTQDLETLVGAMAGREVRMAELKRVIKRLRKQIVEADMEPVANDPLLEDILPDESLDWNSS